MTARTCLAIVLAAGEGTRMRSARPKVLHPLAGRRAARHEHRAEEEGEPHFFPPFPSLIFNFRSRFDRYVT